MEDDNDLLEIAVYESLKEEEERQRQREKQQRQREEQRRREEQRKQQEQNEFEQALALSRAQHRRDQAQQQDAELACDLQLIHAVERTETEDQQAAAAVAFQEETRHRNAQERWQHSWDCPQCTFRNKPYQSPCQACHAEPPSHVLTFCKVPAKVRFGVELELVIPKGTRDGYSCAWMAEQLTKSGVPTVYQGYTHETMTRTWKIVTDASLESSQDDLCLELVSPVLCGEEGLEAMRHALESVRQIGIAINDSCGFHVHIDATNGAEQGLPALGTLEGLQRICQRFVLVETAFDAIVARDNARCRRRANRARYCQSNLLAFGSQSPRQIWERIDGAQSKAQLVQRLCPNRDRYRKLNLTNLVNDGRPDTIEFRQHGGVDELVMAEAWVRLLLRFCEQSVRQDLPCSWASGPHPSTSQSVSRLFELIQCPGLESFYTLESRLYPSSLATADNHYNTRRGWGCKVCRKSFRCAQDLSNHCRATGHRSS